MLSEILKEIFLGRNVDDTRKTRVKLDTIPCPPKDLDPSIAQVLTAEAQLHRTLIWALVGSTAPWAAELIFQRGRLMLPVLLQEIAAARRRLSHGVYSGRSRDEALSERITVLIRAITAIRV